MVRRVGLGKTDRLVFQRYILSRSAYLIAFGVVGEVVGWGRLFLAGKRRRRFWYVSAWTRVFEDVENKSNACECKNSNKC